MRIAVIGNYLPRLCGIATFTHNFVSSLKAAGDTAKTPDEIFVVAINDQDAGYDYPAEVKYSIRQCCQDDYRVAAGLINQWADVCVLQHEYGIFGGESGVFILSLIQLLKVPLAATFHTVLEQPSFHEKHIVSAIGQMAVRVTVMNSMAVKYLKEVFDIPQEKIRVIAHGVPDFSNITMAPEKTGALSPANQFPGKTILCTFGLLGRSKGIETVINALPALAAVNKDFVYIVLGKTHPVVRRHRGEEYRNYLRALAEKKGVGDYILFIDEFLEEDDLKRYLSEVDIYITPYLNKAQITSGTLSYAVGAGTCVLSTPYWHAVELLANGKGMLFDFGNSSELAAHLTKLFEHPDSIRKIRKKAALFGKTMYWKQIGRQYLDLLAEACTLPVWYADWTGPMLLERIPPFQLRHLKRLTDKTGALEHARFSVANCIEGYCLDDNARALQVVLMAWRHDRNSHLLELADVYLRYIQLMQREDGTFYNRFSYDRRLMETDLSEDAFGRTIWAMGYLIEDAPSDACMQFAKQVLSKASPHFSQLSSPRGMAHTIAGLAHFLQRYPDNEFILAQLNELTGKLVEGYQARPGKAWRWFEPILSYDNAILPMALWYSYSVTKDEDTLVVARDTTAFLDEQTFRNGRLSLIGNEGWYKVGETRAVFAQQPIDAMAMVLLHKMAWENSGDDAYRVKMLIAYSWFLGNNDLHLPLYDSETGGCSDGIERDGINRNQGAESTISYSLACLTVLPVLTQMAQKDRFASIRADRSELRNWSIDQFTGISKAI